MATKSKITVTPTVTREALDATPDRALALLRGIGTSAAIRGALEAVVGVATLLDRLDELEESKDKTDRAAVALLAERGIGPAKRKRLRGLVARAPPRRRRRR